MYIFLDRVSNFYKILFLLSIVIIILLQNLYFSNLFWLLKLIYNILIYFSLFTILESIYFFKYIINFFNHSKLEVSKIIWPTISEINKIIFIVFVFIFIISWIIWFIDIALIYILSIIINLEL